MDLFLSFALLGLASAEKLRFSACPEQSSELACGRAVVAGLLSLHLEARAADAPLPPLGMASLADLGEALGAAGVGSAAFLMDLAGLRSCLEAGWSPLVAHYAKPEPHFALVLGAAEGLLVAADPARGLEALEEAEFLERWSGAILLVDRSSVGATGLGLREASVRGALERARIRRLGEAARAAVRAAAAAGGGIPW